MSTSAKVCVWAVAVTALACGRPNPEESVRKALDQANIRSVEVVVGDDQVVHLSGTVETLAERTRAEEIAAAAIGTGGRVFNDLTVVALEEPVPDDPDQQTTNAIDSLIDADPVLKERDVNVHVAAGAVTLTGEVKSAQEKARAERITRGAPGVTNVTNDLQVRADR